MPTTRKMDPVYITVYFNDKVDEDFLLCFRRHYNSSNLYLTYVAHEECIPKNISRKTLWEIGSAVDPWFPPSPSQELIFRPSIDVLKEYLLKLQAPIATESKLANLPNELLQVILWEYAAFSPLSRSTMALQFDRDLINTLRRSIQRPPMDFDFTDPALRTFEFEFLGIYYRPFATNIPLITDASVIRLTVDRLGIRTIEILSEYPITEARQSRNGVWYIVENFYHACKKFKLVSNVGSKHSKV
jgi:hypothetical protein